jgi:hypothetical protein
MVLTQFYALFSLDFDWRLSQAIYLSIKNPPNFPDFWAISSEPEIASLETEMFCKKDITQSSVEQRKQSVA